MGYIVAFVLGVLVATVSPQTISRWIDQGLTGIQQGAKQIAKEADQKTDQ